MCPELDEYNELIELSHNKEILDEIFHFIYGGTEIKKCEHYEKLLAAARYYKVRELEDACKKMIIQTLNFNNAIKTLIFANKQHNTTEFKGAIIKFIGK